ncbi:MAG TPA: glycosyltransferase [Daejeonella sp.]|nr:glycosyltransferase [Daejeonella sp.]
MHIVIASNVQLPALEYGGTERIMWWLGKELVRKGHQVSFLVKPGSSCDFARVISYNPAQSLQSQLPADADLVHTHFVTHEQVNIPQVTTIHGNEPIGLSLPLNSVFVSKNHAERHGSQVFVYNGLDFSDYGEPALNEKRLYYHFLGKAAWRLKNVRGAIALANACSEKLRVIGGYRLNIKMGFRFTPNLNVKFMGMLGGEKKNQVLRKSKGLIFPVLWHEPFGIAIIESLYFGCPVFGTPYGSLPELVPPAVGFLSANKEELIEQIKHAAFDAETCHQYAVQNFSSSKMAEEYFKLYQQVLNGENLNQKAPARLQDQKSKFLPFD